MKILDALFSLAAFCCAGMVLVACTAWFTCKLSDWVSACLWERKMRRSMKACDAFEEAQKRVMGDYYPGATVVYAAVVRPTPDRYTEPFLIAVRQEIDQMIRGQG